MSEVKELKKTTKIELMKFAENINEMNKNLKNFQADLQILTLSAIDRDTLDSSLKEFRKQEDQKIDQAVSDLENRIEYMRKLLLQRRWRDRVERAASGFVDLPLHQVDQQAPLLGEVVEQSPRRDVSGIGDLSRRCGFVPPRRE